MQGQWIDVVHHDAERYAQFFEVARCDHAARTAATANIKYTQYCVEALRPHPCPAAVPQRHALLYEAGKAVGVRTKKNSVVLRGGMRRMHKQIIINAGNPDCA